MKILVSILLFVTLHFTALAGVPMTPMMLQGEIEKSQCAFTGKLEIVSYTFYNKEAVVPDPEGKLFKLYRKDRRHKDVPGFITFYARIVPSENLWGNYASHSTLLHQTWSEPCAADCPHFTGALNGEEQIWLITNGGLYSKHLTPQLAHLATDFIEKVKSIKQK